MDLNLIVEVVLAVLLFISELLALLDIPQNGILQTILLKVRTLKHEPAEQSKHHRNGAD